jgi:hypothetical protein
LCKYVLINVRDNIYVNKEMDITRVFRGEAAGVAEQQISL